MVLVRKVEKPTAPLPRILPTFWFASNDMVCCRMSWLRTDGSTSLAFFLLLFFLWCFFSLRSRSLRSRERWCLSAVPLLLLMPLVGALLTALASQLSSSPVVLESSELPPDDEPNRSSSMLGLRWPCISWPTSAVARPADGCSGSGRSRLAWRVSRSCKNVLARLRVEKTSFGRTAGRVARSSVGTDDSARLLTMLATTLSTSTESSRASGREMALVRRLALGPAKKSESVMSACSTWLTRLRLWRSECASLERASRSESCSSAFCSFSRRAFSFLSCAILNLIAAYREEIQQQSQQEREIEIEIEWYLVRDRHEQTSSSY